MGLSATAQKKEKRKTTRVVPADTVLTEVDPRPQKYHFNFHNINSTHHYYNEKRYKKITQLRKSGTPQKLYAALKEYVGNFGISNFSKNTSMIWELAILSEQLGQTAEAKYFYRLVLKHHRQDIDVQKIRKKYDSLDQQFNPKYVDLSYYYQLVDARKEIDTLQPPRGVLLNMGDWVNSTKADYGPSYLDEMELLIFTSQRNSNHRGVDLKYDEDIFYTTKLNDIWEEAKVVNGVNSQYNEGSPWLTKDKKQLYFTRCNAPNTHGGCDLYVAHLQQDSTWGTIKNLGANINSKGWDSHPSLSHGEDTLFFASDKMGGFGLSDIYYTTKNTDGTWKASKNLGPVVNTRMNEVSPFYHHKFDVLYFSSNGQNFNFGQYDIFKTYQSNGFWEEPKNIGPLVNSVGSEFYFTIDGNSKNIYYAKSDSSGLHEMDLYSFPMPMEAQPSATVSFEGTLLDSETGDPLKGIVSIIDLDEGVEVAPKHLDLQGQFQFDLINKRKYLLIIQGDEYFRIEEIFHLDGDTNVDLSTIKIEPKLEFSSIEFDNGKSDLKAEMYGDLNLIVDYMLDNPDVSLKISGHTDSDGDENLNLKLSQDRADEIKNYLVEFGNIAAERIEAVGFGSSAPIVNELSDEDKKLNRRVEFEIIKEK